MLPQFEHEVAKLEQSDPNARQIVQSAAAYVHSHNCPLAVKMCVEVCPNLVGVLYELSRSERLHTLVELAQQDQFSAIRQLVHLNDLLADKPLRIT